MGDLLIQGGRVIDPASGFDQTADILLSNGVIAAIGRIPSDTGAQRLDAEGCIVGPGLIDVHVHFREPGPEHRETIATGCHAAAIGVFIAILGVALVYELSTGALDWGIKTRSGNLNPEETA